MEAFRTGEDIHSRTASDIFGVFPEMVNADMRRQAKVINFGVLYGMSAFGLAKELGVTQKLAQAYIDGYFQKYAKVREYLDGLLAQARREGYVTTLLKRRRYLPEITSHQPSVRQFAERMAINAPIQGTAADLIKVAMVRIFRRLAAEGLQAAMIMQVHDELVFEVPVSEREALMCTRLRGDGGGPEAGCAPAGGDRRGEKLGRGAYLRGKEPPIHAAGGFPLPASKRGHGRRSCPQLSKPELCVETTIRFL